MAIVASCFNTRSISLSFRKDSFHLWTAVTTVHNKFRPSFNFHLYLSIDIRQAHQLYSYAQSPEVLNSLTNENSGDYGAGFNCMYINATP